jgi:hypothetical protein
MRKFLLLLLFISSYSFSQQTNELWTGMGVSKKLNSNLELTLDINSRVYDYTLRLIYPELSLKYKVNKWFKPSIDYRGLNQLNKYGNYKYSNRFNFNLNFEKSIKRYTFGFRLRYQYVFNGIRSTEDYSPEFDQTIRLKPSVKYEIKKSKFTPSGSIEWFYNPENGPTGDRFTKIRASFGTDINLKGPHLLSVYYLYGQNINVAKSKSQNIISIYYCYTIGGKKKKEKKEN